jgi:GNAT superfamily N-acetyltransferase
MRHGRACPGHPRFQLGTKGVDTRHKAGHDEDKPWNDEDRNAVESNMIQIRPFHPDDRAAWEPLWQGYLTFYKSSLPAEVTEETWRRLNDPSEPMHGLAAVLDGRIVGIVHYLYHRSTWTTGNYCYLQDLFTAEEARGHGVGRALIEAVYEKAQADGASRVYWLTHETNVSAQALYEKVASRSGFIQYRHLLG